MASDEEHPNISPPSTHFRSMRAKLIFNPGSGDTKASGVEIMDVIQEMQNWKLVPEAFLIEPGCDLPGVVQDALARGMRMFVVCGGDGTISSVASLLAGTRATLGIIPLGTQNNTALSLGIPEDIPAAIAILRTGKRIKVDVGMVTNAEMTTPFLEVCSVGLVAALYPSADDIQKGKLGKVPDLLATLAATPPAEIHLTLDGKTDIRSTGYVVLVSNMPYIGLHYQVGDLASFKDGFLDVLLFAELSKLDLLGYVFQGLGEGTMDDPRIQRFRVRKLEIDTQPAMPLMVDGNVFGEGRVRIEVRKHVLAVMVGSGSDAAHA